MGAVLCPHVSTVKLVMQSGLTLAYICIMAHAFIGTMRPCRCILVTCINPIAQQTAFRPLY